MNRDELLQQLHALYIKAETLTATLTEAEQEALVAMWEGAAPTTVLGTDTTSAQMSLQDRIHVALHQAEQIAQTLPDEQLSEIVTNWERDLNNLEVQLQGH